MGRFVTGKGRKTHVAIKLLPPYLAAFHLADIMSPYFLDDDDVMFRFCMEYMAGRPVPDDFVPPTGDRMREIIVEGLAKFLVMGKVPILELCEEIVAMSEEDCTDSRKNRIPKNMLSLFKGFLKRRKDTDLPRLLAAGLVATPETDLSGVGPTVSGALLDVTSLQNGSYDTKTAQQPLAWHL